MPTKTTNPCECCDCGPEGACCDGDTCSVVKRCKCKGEGKRWLGDGTKCDPNPCVGACCIDGNCSQQTKADCEAAGGSFKGVGVPCDPDPCDPLGACCIAGDCTQKTKTDCQAAGGAWLGEGVACAPGLCVGGCCELSGGCRTLSPEDCRAASGRFVGLGTICADCGKTCLDITGHPTSVSFSYTYEGVDLRKWPGYEASGAINGAKFTGSVMLPPPDWYGYWDFWADEDVSMAKHGIQEDGPDVIQTPDGPARVRVSFQRCGFGPYGNLGPILDVYITGYRRDPWWDSSGAHAFFTFSGPDQSGAPVPEARPSTDEGVSWEFIRDPYFGSVCFSGFQRVDDLNFQPDGMGPMTVAFKKWTISLSGCGSGRANPLP